MYKIEFYKNNKKINIDDNELKYFFVEKKLIKETEEAIIILDFINKLCSYTLKKEKITININVIKMKYKNEKHAIILSYILETEPEILNTIYLKYIDA